jgi:hypothetical protein
MMATKSKVNLTIGSWEIFLLLSVLVKVRVFRCSFVLLEFLRFFERSSWEKEAHRSRRIVELLGGVE